MATYGIVPLFRAGEAEDVAASACDGFGLYRGDLDSVGAVGGGAPS